ncbi:MAG: aldose 1-epimerase family protein [Flaviramulus sp.]|nr:aldose 1-epimerase family protein [Flaviramulus sp.]
MVTLQNDKLKIAVKNTGAELCKIASVINKTDFMWDANPNVWGSFAPNLFPIIGALKNNSYYFENAKFELPKHGFIRNNNQLKLINQTANSITFSLIYNEVLLKIYPFKFEFKITFVLIDNIIEIHHSVINLDTKTMYFSLGGHPAFKCPVYKNESYDDYSLEFEHSENSSTHLINMKNGLISRQIKLVLNDNKTLNLHHDLFNEDALIFKDLKSRKVTLKSNKNGNILSVMYQDFNYLGIWAKPTGDYVCIEPWLGIADNEATNQNLDEKEAIISLKPNDTFKATYSIEIHNKHLV